jgi:two-component system repressor protein LuxO
MSRFRSVARPPPDQPVIERVEFRRPNSGARALIDRLETAVAERSAGGRSHDGKTSEPDFCGFIGRSPPMLQVYEQIRRMAPSSAPVLITGETGTGKELCAEAVHALAAPDAGGRPFVAINCSAIPRDLMESEIFGHVRGAFTGATDNRPGAAELAHGGTLFLDEVAEMDLGLQAKLLRFLQSGAVRRVGGTQAKQVDVRIVCATNRDPLTEVAAGRLRADLYYRLAVLPIHLPPLRERGSDIQRLADAFLLRSASEERRAFKAFGAEAEMRLAAYSWPGNVRELANLIRRIVVLHDGDVVTPEMLSPLTDQVDAGKGSAPIHPFHIEERRIIETAVAAHAGNIARAAAALALSPSTVYRKRQSWQDRPVPLG